MLRCYRVGRVPIILWVSGGERIGGGGFARGAKTGTRLPAGRSLSVPRPCGRGLSPAFAGFGWISLCEIQWLRCRAAGCSETQKHGNTGREARSAECERVVPLRGTGARSWELGAGVQRPWRGGGFALGANPGTRLPAGRSVSVPRPCGRGRSPAFAGFGWISLREIQLCRRRGTDCSETQKLGNSETPGARREALSARGWCRFAAREMGDGS
jgi:hypothetical protein